MDSVVIGGGAWGTAIANLLAFNTQHVTILCRNTGVIDSINERHVNTKYLSAFPLNRNISATSNLNVLKDAELIFIAVPSQSMRELLQKVRENIAESAQIILCNKGIERGSLLLMSEVVHEELPKNDVFVLSGPNFAHEILAKKPSFSNLAGSNKAIYHKIASALSTETFFTKYIADINGTQILGSFKNVIAIICGVLVRIGAGSNTLSALMSLALEEARSFITIKGGDPATIMEFCGIGDLVLTCFSDKSRNFRYGYRLIDNYNDNVLVEGKSTLESLYELARVHNINCVLTKMLYTITRLNLHGMNSFEQDIKQELNSAFMSLLGRMKNP
ncbi:NAD(P)H-dependent glycerol-3-phosphate dehydrogenase [Neorickettsia findlayensis]|uniref:Glycerol-3-phosphate dehydrogenase [NAD(P)+] n=2 Tax=Neorickettsia findlayensis TaxID=2686014 RepID=A0A6P1GCU7_9RICK|nr:NAD(P)H-dependent glycerol-3-phosphate dehydrogenase [Neorickettsia findlayensis]